jgi:glycosyltransferase involved in cell wall biosynthesis
VCHPPYGFLHEQPVVAFLIIGIPRTPLATPPRPRSSGPVRIVHAPSHPVAKGTARIREAVEAVLASGRDVEYVELVGVPNEHVRHELARCDFVVDSAYSDTPMAGLAADAALFGRPTIVGGYAWDETRRFTRDADLPPSHCCNPRDLRAAIEMLVDDEEYRLELGRRAHAFVSERWSSTAVAERFLRLFDGPAPAEWLCDPREIRYLGGWGQSQRRSRELTRATIDVFGVGALQLRDKPELERLYVDFARVTDARLAAEDD